jgi:hypothetical protein
MFVHTDAYIDKCLILGILTTDNIRKYPLRSANLAVVLKVYATFAGLPYQLNNQQYEKVFATYRLYLTDQGLQWLFEEFKQHSLSFWLRLFPFIFNQITEKDIQRLEKHPAFGNFKGKRGVRTVAGSKQRAILEIKINKATKKIHYNSVAEARKAVLELSRFYPVDHFLLYRIKQDRNRSYPQLIPTILKESKRGAVCNLPHVRNKT